AHQGWGPRGGGVTPSRAGNFRQVGSAARRGKGWAPAGGDPASWAIGGGTASGARRPPKGAREIVAHDRLGDDIGRQRYRYLSQRRKVFWSSSVWQRCPACPSSSPRRAGASSWSGTSRARTCRRSPRFTRRQKSSSSSGEASISG